MKLARIVTFHLPKLRNEWQSWEIRVGDVLVKTLRALPNDNRIRLLVMAVTSLEFRPKVTAENRVVVPKFARARCEHAIEIAANTLSVAEQVRRSISSAFPSVALIAEDEVERNWLEARDCFHFEPVGVSHFGVQVTCNCLEILSELTDRTDGLALLAEANSNDHLSGQFREHIRVFERAFRLPPRRLIQPLSAFLRPLPFGYCEKEVDHWVNGIRDPLTHADQRSAFIVEADVRSVIQRVKQAAYDVLFNKKNWRSPDSERRCLWIPTAGIGANGPIVKQHTAGTLTLQVLDEFNAYPRDLGASIDNPPSEWWAKFPKQDVPQG